MAIPKIINQLWIGPKPRPEKLMNTWKEKNPEWEHRIWAEKDITSRKWINQAWIDFFWKDGVWNGVKNICQYEILLEEGGAFFDADTECLLPIDELFTDDYDCFSYWENEISRPGMIQPFIAAAKGSKFVAEAIEGIRIKEPHGVSFQQTGNKYLGEIYVNSEHKDKVKIYPSYMFNPEHFAGENPEIKGKIYARHFYGSTVDCIYDKGEKDLIDKIIEDNPVTISRLIGIKQVEVIMRKLQKTLSLEGDIVELGCNIGTNALYVRRVLDAYKSDKEFHVYDSFEGLPEPVEADGDKCGAGHMRQDPERLIAAFEEAGLKLPVIHKGWFKEIPDNEYPDKICFAFFDGDFYTSIMDSFNKVYHKMVRGGIIIIHDFTGEQLPGVKVACDEFLADKPEGVIVNQGMAVMVKQ